MKSKREQLLFSGIHRTTDEIAKDGRCTKHNKHLFGCYECLDEFQKASSNEWFQKQWNQQDLVKEWHSYHDLRGLIAQDVKYR
jgi:hypothetical protein